MKLPDHIRVGGVDYAILFKPAPVDPDDRTAIGIAHHTNLQISIDSALPDQRWNETAWHEIVHSIDKQYFNQTLFPAKECEDKVSVFANAIAQVLRDLGISFER
jgi:hypothetical protein